MKFIHGQQSLREQELIKQLELAHIDSLKGHEATKFSRQQVQIFFESALRHHELFDDVIGLANLCA